MDFGSAAIDLNPVTSNNNITRIEIKLNSNKILRRTLMLTF